MQHARQPILSLILTLQPPRSLNPVHAHQPPACRNAMRRPLRRHTPRIHKHGGKRGLVSWGGCSAGVCAAALCKWGLRSLPTQLRRQAPAPACRAARMQHR
eukprot:217132-Pelagomonas_calceolata.AAC.3